MLLILFFLLIIIVNIVLVSSMEIRRLVCFGVIFEFVKIIELVFVFVLIKFCKRKVVEEDDNE